MNQTHQETSKISPASLAEAAKEDRKFRYGLYIFFASLFVGVVGIFYFGIQPKPVEKIRLSQFESTKIAANSVLISIGAEIEKSPILFFGIAPTMIETVDVLKDFLISSAGSKLNYDLIVWDQRLGDSLLEHPVQVMDLAENPQGVLDFLNRTQADHQRVLVVTSFLNSSQLLAESFASQITKRSDLKPTSITLVKFPRTRDEEDKATVPCNTGPQDEQGIGHLGCMVLTKSRYMYKKRLAADQLVGILDQVGLHDFLFMLTKEPLTN